MRLIDVLREWSTTRNLILSVVFSMVLIGILGYGTQVLVYGVYGNYTMPDTRFSYTFEEIQAVFDGLGANGLQAWSMIHLLDYLFPLFYMFAMVFGITLELRKLKYYDRFNKILLIPIFGCIMDYIENILVQTQVFTYPNISSLVIALASYVTSLKWIFLGLAFAVIIVLLFQIIYQRHSAEPE